MTLFEKNIFSLYGKKGKQWLRDLPNIIHAISVDWNLSNLNPVNNLSYNYILSGFQNNKPIILKLSLDIDSLKQEFAALNAFSNYGCVKVLAQQDGALLLERAIPGISLKSYFPSQESESIDIICNLIKKLHTAKIPENKFPSLKYWLGSLDKNWDIPINILQKARETRDQLLTTSSPSVLLHGDLHHDNILKNGKDWVVIDPKGMIGEQAYETAAFIYNPIPELLDFENVVLKIKERIMKFGLILNIDPVRILNWCFVKAVHGWVCNLEDDLDPTYFQNMTRLILPLLILR